MNNNIDNLLSIGEAARLLGVSPETLRNWHKKNLLQPYVTPGGHRRYAKADIENLLRKKVSLSSELQFNTKKSVSRSFFIKEVSDAYSKH